MHRQEVLGLHQPQHLLQLLLMGVTYSKGWVGTGEGVLHRAQTRDVLKELRGCTNCSTSFSSS